MKMNEFISENTEDLLVFITGAIPSGVVAYSLIDNIIIPILLATLTGFLGGGAAILGKLFVNWLIKKITKKKNRL